MKTEFHYQLRITNPTFLGALKTRNVIVFFFFLVLEEQSTEMGPKGVWRSGGNSCVT